MRANCPDERLLAKLSHLFQAEATIYSQDITNFDSYGQPTGTWAKLAGHERLCCLVGTKSGGESKRTDYVPVVGNFTVLLKGYYPDIREKMRVTADGVSYDILLVRHDPLKIITALDVNRTEV